MYVCIGNKKVSSKDMMNGQIGITRGKGVGIWLVWLHRKWITLRMVGRLIRNFQRRKKKVWRKITNPNPPAWEMKAVVDAKNSASEGKCLKRELLELGE
tara:strand:+ start:3251 stop:3547 length:297 start_codon:yes stop_codon:yes gene_type:complete